MPARWGEGRRSGRVSLAVGGALVTALAILNVWALTMGEVRSREKVRYAPPRWKLFQLAL